ncbi:WxL domain-containing protein [Erwinia sp. CPCC 100877]|nr:WxL domain-containing protein [Erwinia sp. CPCC 100877]
MKKKLLATLLLSGVTLSYVAAPVALADDTDAAQTSVGSTITDATFTAGDRPDPAKPEEGPDEPNPLDPDTDENGDIAPLPDANNVYVTHLPNISFGSNKTDLKTTEYKALTEKRTKNQGTETFYMPHSVQVADLSGNSATKWKLSVKQDKVFKTADTTPHELTNTRIRIYGNTLTNTTNASADLAGKVVGAALDQSDDFGAYSEIPVGIENQNDLVVLENKTAGFTLNSYTSAVFENDYAAENYDAATTAAAARYEGVKLNVPASDQVQAKAYKASLTWTLTVEP